MQPATWINSIINFHPEHTCFVKIASSIFCMIDRLYDVDSSCDRPKDDKVCIAGTQGGYSAILFLSVDCHLGRRTRHFAGIANFRSQKFGVGKRSKAEWQQRDCERYGSIRLDSRQVSYLKPGVRATIARSKRRLSAWPAFHFTS